MEEQFFKEAKEGWRFAADAAIITDERAGSEHRKHTSGGVFIAVDSNLGAVVGAEGAIGSIPGNDGRIAQAWVNVTGGLGCFSVYLWHSERWTPRNEALLEALVKQANTLVACDANMSPEDVEKSLWFRKERMHVLASNGVSTCRSKGPKGERVEKTYDHVITCNGFRRKISKMEVVEDFESRPQKAVSFVLEREEETQEWNEQKLPKVWTGYSGGRLPGRSTGEAGGEEEEEKEENGQRNIRYEIAQKVVASIKEKAGRYENAKLTSQRTTEQNVKQGWDCSQIGNEEEEEEEVWQGENQMVLQWAEDEKLEEILEQRRRKWSASKADVMQEAPELVVHERMVKAKTDGCKGKEESERMVH